jgi:peptidoglycan/LPS O-acetylase OafA/YrhL
MYGVVMSGSSVRATNSEPAPTDGPGRPTNNFDALRFWAALAVLWSHAIPISEGSEANEPLFALSAGQTTAGSIAVTMFFVISGYLITKSFERSHSSWRFVKARALRIMPAFLVVLLLLAFIVGPIVTTLPLASYVRSSEVYRYVLLQAAFLSFPDLPGVFAENPLPYINGSLWTLRYEVICYVAVFLLGICRLLNRWVLLGLYCAGLVFLLFHEHGRVSDGMHLMPTKNAVDLGTKFLAGALIYKWRLSLLPSVALGALGIGVACLFLGHFATAGRTVIPYLVMYLALGMSLRLPSPIKLGDLSYGTYIYAWPVKQLIVLIGGQPAWWMVAGLATPIVLLLAWLSWHLIEKVALSYKDSGPDPFTREAASLRQPAAG